MSDESSTEQPGTSLQWLAVIVVDGVAWSASGKTTFIRTISEIEVVDAASASPGNVTVVMDFGRISFDGGVLYIMGKPNASGLRFIQDVMEDMPVAVIMMVDSASPPIFRYAKSMVETLDTYLQLPIVVAANFQDKPEAWSADDLRIALRIPSDIPVIPCVATDRTSVKNVLLALCYKILEDAENDTAER